MAYSTRKLIEPFSLHPESEARRKSAIHVASLIAPDPAIISLHKRELLSIAAWKITEADGKYCRFRSAGVLADPSAKIQHEHVITRKSLVDAMIAEPDRCGEILSTAHGCLVTVDEHEALGRVDPSVTGWERYRSAGIEVYDMATTPRAIWRPSVRHASPVPEG